MVKPASYWIEDVMRTRPGRIVVSFMFVIGIFRIFFIDIHYWFQLWHRKRRMNLKKSPHRRGGVPSRSSRGRLNLILYVFFVIWGFLALFMFLNTIFVDKD